MRDPRHATRAVREYLAALDEQGEPVTVPASISPTDPAARWTAMDGPAFYAYSTNYLIDVQAGIIVDVEATPTLRTAEVKATQTMIERVEERFALKPERLIGDMAYGNAELLGWMVNDKGIEPHVPLWDRTQRDDGTLSSSDFEWNEQANEYRCPQGLPLRSEWRIFKRPRTRITKAHTIIYHANQAACSKCPMKSRCCPNTPNREIARSVHEAARDVARDIAKTDAYKQSRKDRKKVEMLFAHLKRILRLDRLRLRGPNGAHDEFLWRRPRRTYDEWRSGCSQQNQSYKHGNLNWRRTLPPAQEQHPSAAPQNARGNTASLIHRVFQRHWPHPACREHQLKMVSLARSSSSLLFRSHMPRRRPTLRALHPCRNQRRDQSRYMLDTTPLLARFGQRRTRDRNDRGEISGCHPG